MPAAPSMVPTQLKMLSPSGNAEIPASALVCFLGKKGNDMQISEATKGMYCGEKTTRGVGLHDAGLSWVCGAAFLLQWG